MDLKPPLTYDQQIAHLAEEHKLTIKDEKFARKVLQKVNYYRFTGYGIGLTRPHNKDYYRESITMEHLFQLYCFDSQFKNNLIRTIEQIEIEFRTQVAYHLSNKYGSDVLMHESIFIHKTNKAGKSIYSIITDNLNKEIKRQKKNPFVNHHIQKYDGRFPIWVSVELMTFGNLSSLYSILQREDQKAIARYYSTSPKYLQNWISCLVEVRNICAHYTRLYNMPLKQNPLLYPEYKQYIKRQNKIFPILLIIKRILNANDQWTSLLKDLKNTFNKYQKVINYSFMGFPKNWEESGTKVYGL
ncbi:Abi family protein [Aerococcus loyolae]|uniref:Abi family protein n=2 Tax=Aerococcus loyolae TaxID=2976809 RepID=UPI001244A5A0|nr:Abi family protein [Aerococcus loyolae]KAA9219173.1 Abi family protein [Aerococcus loyolae]